MVNFLEQTREAIESSGHRPSDIVFIGSVSSGHRCTWGEFCILADAEYDDGYGGNEVASDLRVVFSSGQQMWRGEYDGSEWWEYSTPFVEPQSTSKITSVFGGWSLEHNHRDGE